MLASSAVPDRDWDALRVEIGSKVRALRTQRLWTQAELGKRLGLSQARLSEIERGLGSFSAEHLLELFRLFNVDASHFASSPPDPSSQLQNTLARLGARHLVESETTLPSDRIAQVNQAVVEVLADPSNPRFVTALAPVLVTRIEDVQLDVIASRLYPLGLSHRLSWVVGNTVAALDRLEAAGVNGALAQRRRARLVLGAWLERTNPKNAPTTKREDVLDVMIRSDASVKDAKRAGSEISRRWGIVSWLTVDDFVVALREAA
jgi:transcriptional regulator with XRE-family HTH domain